MPGAIPHAERRGEPIWNRRLLGTPDALAVHVDRQFAAAPGSSQVVPLPCFPGNSRSYGSTVVATVPAQERRDPALVIPVEHQPPRVQGFQEHVKLVLGAGPVQGADPHFHGPGGSTQVPRGGIGYGGPALTAKQRLAEPARAIHHRPVHPHRLALATRRSVKGAIEGCVEQEGRFQVLCTAKSLKRDQQDQYPQDSHATVPILGGVTAPAEVPWPRIGDLSVNVTSPENTACARPTQESGLQAGQQRSLTAGTAPHSNKGCCSRPALPHSLDIDGRRRFAIRKVGTTTMMRGFGTIGFASPVLRGPGIRVFSQGSAASDRASTDRERGTSVNRSIDWRTVDLMDAIELGQDNRLPQIQPVAEGGQLAPGVEQPLE